jgi:hypothetical protein
MTMPGAEAHIIAESQDKVPLQMRSRLSALGHLIRQDVNTQNKSQQRIAIAMMSRLIAIGISHTTVSQQAEQVRMDTGEQATEKHDRSRSKIDCR